MEGLCWAKGIGSWDISFLGIVHPQPWGPRLPQTTPPLQVLGGSSTWWSSLTLCRYPSGSQWHCWLESPSDREVSDSCGIILSPVSWSWSLCCASEDTGEEFTLDSVCLGNIHRGTSVVCLPRKQGLLSARPSESQPICWLEGAIHSWVSPRLGDKLNPLCTAWTSWGLQYSCDVQKADVQTGGY